MTNVHIFKGDEEKFYRPYISFINTYFNKENHEFIIVGSNTNQAEFIQLNSNVEFFPKNVKGFFKISKKMANSSKVIIHGLLMSQITFLLFLKPFTMKKVFWIVWGADLYFYQSKKNDFKHNINEFFRKIVIKRIPFIATLVKDDYYLAEKWYNVNAVHLKAIYISDERTQYIREVLENRKTTKNGTLRILIGNNATPSNNHLEVFEYLKKYSNRDIEIICPLSYGDNEYAKLIENKGKEMFGSKFSALVELVPMREYIHFLDTIDIGVFNNDRQQGLGNIFSLLYLGKKVFLRPSTTMWNEIRNEMGIEVFSIEEINNNSFTDFSDINKETIEKNFSITQKRYDPNEIIDIWSKIFNHPLK
ncbi:MAG: TDP-N-acetylfucosamine:lipid II N-acetylfucosaminyltransferase [Alkalibacterium sp.]|nr:TDP-N-acetylfucosamine:lipid II N-acetylfucosaminyltransferase [Alkalibacterium sp.]